jgi:acetate kinase
MSRTDRHACPLMDIAGRENAPPFGMTPDAAVPGVLVCNVGSSSIRFAVYQAGDALQRHLHGTVDRIGTDEATLVVNRLTDPSQETRPLAAADLGTAVAALLDWLEAEPLFASVTAAGHRVVHGMDRAAAEPITPALLAELRQLTPYAPAHLPGQLAMIEALAERRPRLSQLACFDTTFHRGMPRVATLLPLPRRFDARGVRRYGFHGLSYAYLMTALVRLGDPAATAGRVILAHLGNGASLAAVRDGRSIDTSMGFTPAAGLPMSTRSGDLDPGLLDYLSRSEGLTTTALHRMLLHESGLLGVSETSGDMRDLLAAEAHDVRAAEAVALFCYQAKKWIGAFAAALGGVDTLVFAGGIGEHAPVIRQRICDGLGFLGIELHDERNAATDSIISTDTSRATVRVIPTDEALMIAAAVVAAGVLPSPTH